MSSLSWREATIGAVLYVALENDDDRIRLSGPRLFEHTGSKSAPLTTVVSLERLGEIDVRSVWKNEWEVGRGCLIPLDMKT